MTHRAEFLADRSLAAGGTVTINLLPFAAWVSDTATPWVGKTMFPWIADKLLGPAVVAVVFTGLTNLVIERLKAKRDQSTKLCDALRTDASILQQLSSEYWGRDATASDKIVEAKIMALQTEFIAGVKLLQTECDLTIASDDTLASIADALTGGEFRSKGRKADDERLNASFTLLSKLRTNILEERSHRISKTGF
jgi:hypothetical protein